jgi:Condensin complex protein MksE
MSVPKQTAEIFEILSKGQFICSNSSNERIGKLFDVIAEDENFSLLCEYFDAINFILEEGDEFYYLSRIEQKVDLERKIETAFKWIEIVDFFKAYDSSFLSGFRFQPSDILVKLNVDAVLKDKLDGLKRWSRKDTYKDNLDSIIKMLCADGFAELENETLTEYKVLSSFKYLEELINSINIPEEVQDEIPE